MSHLISFAVVLCIFVVTSVSSSSNESNKTSESDSSLDHEAESDSTTFTITFTTINVKPSAGPDTHADPYDKNTDGEHSESNTTGSTTTMGSTTTSMGSTTTTSVGSTITTRSTTRGSTASEQTNTAGKSAGIFILLFILFIIVIFATVLFALWRKGKRYSFDLTNNEHDTPLQDIEQKGTIEPIKGSLISLNSSSAVSPVPNGRSGETPESTLCPGQWRDSDDSSCISDLSLNLPVKKVEFNLDLELIGGDPEAAKGATDEPADNGNENNNNDMNAGSDSVELFTEINLDDMQ